MGIEDQLAQWFLAYAYEPLWVYSFIVFIMFASSCGLPLPEEVILISAGLAGYMTSHPDLYPPPYEGAQGVEPITLAVVCLLSVFISDYFIYWVGSYFGEKLMKHPKWKKRFESKAFRRVQKWINQYGVLAPFIFRFTPGLRFPGHMMCGAIGLSRWKFILVDGTAALLTVPTQILLISYYGQVILQYISRGKWVFLAFAITFFVALVFFQWQKSSPEESTPQTDSSPPSSQAKPALQPRNQDGPVKGATATKSPSGPGAKS